MLFFFSEFLFVTLFLYFIFYFFLSFQIVMFNALCKDLMMNLFRKWYRIHDQTFILSRTHIHFLVKFLLLHNFCSWFNKTGVFFSTLSYVPFMDFDIIWLFLGKRITERWRKVTFHFFLCAKWPPTWFSAY